MLRNWIYEYLSPSCALLRKFKWIWYLSHLLVSLRMTYWPQFETWLFALRAAAVPWNFCSRVSLQFLYGAHKSSTSLQTKLHVDHCIYTWTKCDSSMLETYMAIYHFSCLCIMQLFCVSSMHVCMGYAYFIMDTLATKITKTFVPIFSSSWISSSFHHSLMPLNFLTFTNILYFFFSWGEPGLDFLVVSLKIRNVKVMVTLENVLGLTDDNNTEDICYHSPRLIPFGDGFAAHGLWYIGFYMKI